MSRMGMGIPSNHNKIYPVAPASLILCLKYITGLLNKNRSD
jgi:hypothetical protein